MKFPFFLLLLFFLVISCFLIRLLLLRSGWIFLAKKWWRKLEDSFHVYQTFKVPEFNQTSQHNQLYRQVSAYLSSLSTLEDSDFTNLVTGKKRNDIVLCLDPNQTVEDVFLGAQVLWINKEEEEEEGSQSSSCRTFMLMIRKADKRRILRPYLQHIHAVTADETGQKRGSLKQYINLKLDHRRRGWKPVSFTHPSTFDTIAMESDLKDKIKSDLDSFLKAKEYYHRLGRVWKRSYLLYGPPGTGKSSFVAAMANFLFYDVYNIDLSRIYDESDLKFLLLRTTSKSIVVVEDLDRYLIEKSTMVCSSELLNFMDGILTSCCAEERVMVFTMSSKEHVDPAILRPGRIDVHIHFPLSDFSSFKNVANTYLGVKDHKLFPQVEEIFRNGASLSPAEICELMIANRNSPSRAIKLVIAALQTDGDGRVMGKNVERLHSNTSKRSAAGETLEGEGGLSRENSNSNEGKESRKLYGMLRKKSSKVSESLEASPAQSEDNRRSIGGGLLGVHEFSAGLLVDRQRARCLRNVPTPLFSSPHKRRGPQSKHIF